MRVPMTDSAHSTNPHSARIGGTVQAVFAPGDVAKSYDILHVTGGLGGTNFATLQTSNLPRGFRASLSRNGRAVERDSRA
jgi:hypothetical protein